MGFPSDTKGLNATAFIPSLLQGCQLLQHGVSAVRVERAQEGLHRHCGSLENATPFTLAVNLERAVPIRPC